MRPAAICVAALLCMTACYERSGRPAPHGAIAYVLVKCEESTPEPPCVGVAAIEAAPDGENFQELFTVIDPSHEGKWWTVPSGPGFKYRMVLRGYARGTFTWKVTPTVTPTVTP